MTIPPGNNVTVNDLVVTTSTLGTSSIPIMLAGATTTNRMTLATLSTTISSLLVLGTMATQNANAVAITGGTITGTSVSGAAGSFTTLAASGVITSTVVTGTAPFTVASTTVVANLNVSQLLGNTWAVPGTIGSGTPNTGAFTTLGATGNVTLSPTGSVTINPSVASAIDNVNIGATTAGTGRFTSLTVTTGGAAITGAVTATSLALGGQTLTANDALTVPSNKAIHLAAGYIYNAARVANSFNGQYLFNNGTGANFSLAETASNIYSIGTATEGGVTTPYLSVNTSTGAVTVPAGTLGVSGGLTVSTGGAAITGNSTVTGTLSVVGGATLLTTSTALTNGSGASVGTLTNAPAVGNPTKWIGINDNGTTRYVPAW